MIHSKAHTLYHIILFSGLAVLAILNSWWPGILVVLALAKGASAFFKEAPAKDFVGVITLLLIALASSPAMAKLPLAFITDGLILFIIFAILCVIHLMDFFSAE